MRERNKVELTKRCIARRQRQPASKLRPLVSLGPKVLANLHRDNKSIFLGSVQGDY